MSNSGSESAVVNVGNVIKLLRIMAGLKQKNLADKLGVSPNYLSLVETNKREPSLSFIKSICNEFHVPVSFLFLESIEKPQNLSEEEQISFNKIKELIFEIQKIRTSMQLKRG